MQLKQIGMKAITAAFLLIAPVLVPSPAKAETHFSIGIGVAPRYGYYEAPPVAYRPACPGPGYYWTDGYYDPYGAWVGGYWAAPRAYVAPGYYPRVYDHGYRGDDYRNGYRRYDKDDYRGRGNAYGRRR